MSVKHLDPASTLPLNKRCLTRSFEPRPEVGRIPTTYGVDNKNKARTHYSSWLCPILQVKSLGMMQQPVLRGLLSLKDRSKTRSSFRNCPWIGKELPLRLSKWIASLPKIISNFNCLPTGFERTDWRGEAK